MTDLIVSTTSELVGTAKQLLKLSTETPTQETIQPLQEKQQELIDRLSELEASEPNLRESPSWNTIEENIQEFQKLNEKFIENMRVRQGLVHFEIKELKKQKMQLGQVKVVYGSKKSVQKNPKSRINTVS